MGRLTKLERVAAVDRIAHAIVEDGETRQFALAEIAGVHRNWIAPLIKSARERIAREAPPPPALRQTLLARADATYRKACAGHERAVAANDARAANDFLRTANEALRTASKIGGIDELKQTDAGTPKFRIVLESWEDGAPAAALAAANRLSTAPRAAALPRPA